MKAMMIVFSLGFAVLFALVFGFRFMQGADAQNSRGPDMYFDRPEDKEMARAVARGDLGTMRRLLDQGAVDPVTIGRDNTGWLEIAVLAREKAALDFLLARGAMGDAKSKQAGQALYSATLMRGGLNFLRRLHEAGASLDNYGGGEALLLVAFNSGNKEVLQFYLDRGADINIRTNLGGNVALDAATTWHFDAANRFLDLGADPWVMDAIGATLGYVAESVVKVPAWDRRGPQEIERQKLLARLGAIGFPQSAPTPSEGRALRTAGLGSSSNASTASREPRLRGAFSTSRIQRGFARLANGKGARAATGLRRSGLAMRTPKTQRAP